MAAFTAEKEALDRRPCVAEHARPLVDHEAADRVRHGGHDVSRLEAVHLADGHDYRAAHIVDMKTGAVVAAPGTRRGRPAG